jgi:hypothetical protein
MSQHNPEEFVYHYRRGKEIPDYYSFREELYCGTFPEEWARTHKPGTGPHDCRECLRKGSWNGVFIGYCFQCADLYGGERGPGFVEQGEENRHSPYYEKSSAFNTYLKGIALDSIGDKDFYDSANEKMIKIINEINQSGVEAYPDRHYNSDNYGMYYDEGYDCY